MIVTPEIEGYLNQLTPLDHPLLEEMEAFALQEKVPIIGRSSIQMIKLMLVYKGNIRSILEIGTAIGYSTIWLAEAAPNAHIDTIERDEERAKQAQAYLKRANVNEQVQLHVADATTYASSLDQQYDVMFIDAAKGQYQLFFEEYTPKLKSGGLVITDNVFFHGHVVEEEVENKRIRPMVKKMKRYNEWLRDHQDFETSFIPIGDGVAFSIKGK